MLGWIGAYADKRIWRNSCFPPASEPSTVAGQAAGDQAPGDESRRDVDAVTDEHSEGAATSYSSPKSTQASVGDCSGGIRTSGPVDVGCNNTYTSFPVTSEAVNLRLVMGLTTDLIVDFLQRFIPPGEIV
ncbi:unnamed protein product [Protopolystoma xenopodis]|uniref:Uncharacterized protein n=1 Tax=Protopolystoma xenopodis TaxID=117903 RepID=A0A448WTU9_9PLAT|nr:unnamed protein product [Protopolystoma xenopodis]